MVIPELHKIRVLLQPYPINRFHLQVVDLRNGNSANGALELFSPISTQP